MQNTPSSELDALRQEIRQLKEELAQLRRFVRIVPSNPQAGTPASAHLHCSSLILESAEPAPRVEAVLGSSPAGAQLCLKDQHGNTGMRIEASRITLQCGEGEEALRLQADPSSGRGSVTVFDHGSPRAVLKAASTGGCVSVLHDDGRPRGSLLSTEHDGADLLLITPDLKPGVRISSGAPNGGLVSVHRTNGAPAISLLCGPKTAGVALRKADGTLNMLG